MQNCPQLRWLCIILMRMNAFGRCDNTIYRDFSGYTIFVLFQTKNQHKQVRTSFMFIHFFCVHERKITYEYE